MDRVGVLLISRGIRTRGGQTATTIMIAPRMVFVRTTYAGMIVRLILAMSDVSSKTSAISSGKASGRIRNGKESSSDKHKISSGRIRNGKESSSDKHKISRGRIRH